MICFDTNAVIAVLNDRFSPIRARMDATIGLGDALAISSIVLFELRYGAAKSARPDRNAQRIADFLTAPIAVLPFEPADADEAGRSAPRWSAPGHPSAHTTFSSQHRHADAMRCW
jgi:tRNA(fMet)-specific endonuclease VapC